MADITKLSIDDTRFLAELEKTGVLLRGVVVKFVSVFLKQELFSDTFVLSAGNF